MHQLTRVAKLVHYHIYLAVRSCCCFLQLLDCEANPALQLRLNLFLLLFLSLLSPNNFRAAGLKKKYLFLLIPFSSCQIQTRDGWVQSANATTALCRPLETTYSSYLLPYHHWAYENLCDLMNGSNFWSLKVWNGSRLSVMRKRSL